MEDFMWLDYLLSFDYAIVFVLGVWFGVWLSNRCVTKGIKMTQDIQTDFPYNDKEINKELEKE